MRVQLPTALLVLAMAATAAAQEVEEVQQAGPAGERPRFTASVGAVSLAVTLLDEKGRLVSGLDGSNFSVYEDGVEQNLEFFSVGELPLKLVILVDVSGSMRQKLELAQEAAIGFVKSLRPGDEVQVVEFGNRVMTLVEFTSDTDEVINAIRATAAEGATSLYNAIYISLKDLDAHARDALDRRAIIVLSDGNDTASVLGFEDVREQARKSNVGVYAISLRATRADLEKEKYKNAKYELDMLAHETGGVSYAPREIGDLSDVYEQILGELKGQYSLGYVSTNSKEDGKWRRLQIVSGVPGTTVRSREGYFAPRQSRLRRRRR